MDSLVPITRLRPKRDGQRSGPNANGMASTPSTSPSGAVSVAISTQIAQDAERSDGTTAPASVSGSTSFEHELTRVLESELAWVMASGFVEDLAYIEALEFVLYLRSYRA